MVLNIVDEIRARHGSEKAGRRKPRHFLKCRENAFDMRRISFLPPDLRVLQA